MIRTTILTISVSATLGGCVIPIPVPLSRTCRADQAVGYVGQRYTDELGEIVQAKTRSQRLRAVPPNATITQDVRDDRVNLILDDRNMVTRIYCG